MSELNHNNSKVEENDSKVEDQELILTGQVILDDESRNAITEQIRKEVIQRLKDDGLFFDEVVSWLKTLSFSGYYNVLCATIQEVIDKVNTEEELRFNSDEKKYSKLNVIKSILGF